MDLVTWVPQGEEGADEAKGLPGWCGLYSGTFCKSMEV